MREPVFFFKLRQKRRSDYLTGYAAGVVIGDGRILLRDRRIPLVRIVEEQLTLSCHTLGDLELETEHENGWAAWAYAIPAPSWWCRNEPAAPESAPVLEFPTTG
jgi:hypothetical protein